MKLYYSAKYTDCPDVARLPGTYGIRLPALNIRRFLRAFVWLIVLLWLAGLGYFVIYPLVPRVQAFKTEMHHNNPYVLGYTVTTQLFTSLVPPVYDIEELEQLSGGGVRTIEYFDPEGVTISHLEEKSTVLELPAANIKGKVVDGMDQDAMMRGFWHYPVSSVPGRRGNTVFIGHRFQKLPPNTDTFFNLDVAKVGDKVFVYQGDTSWSYTVVSVRVVEKDDASILSSSGDYRLTLVTCTPLWTAKQRLVVTAIQDRVESAI